MPHLVRKVSIGKWDLGGAGSLDQIPADAVTVCSKTSGNTLSFWRAANSSGKEYEDAVLAICGALTSLESIDVLVIEEESFKGLSLNDTEGGTRIPELKGLHVDVADLTLDTLGRVVKIVGERVYAEAFVRILRSDIKKLLKKAVDDKRVEIDALHENVRKALV